MWARGCWGAVWVQCCGGAAWVQCCGGAVWVQCCGGAAWVPRVLSAAARALLALWSRGVGAVWREQRLEQRGWSSLAGATVGAEGLEQSGGSNGWSRGVGAVWREQRLEQRGWSSLEGATVGAEGLKQPGGSNGWSRGVGAGVGAEGLEHSPAGAAAFCAVTGSMRARLRGAVTRAGPSISAAPPKSCAWACSRAPAWNPATRTLLC